MKRQISYQNRALLAIALFFITLIVFGIVMAMGITIIEAGNEMTELRSVGGNSIAEAYYQLQGQVYCGFGGLILLIGSVLWLSGWGGVCWMIVDANRPKSSRAANPGGAAVQGKSGSMGTNAACRNRCGQCGAPLSGESDFCAECGAPTAKPAEGQKICPSCGKPVAGELSFCTKCGCKLG